MRLPILTCLVLAGLSASAFADDNALKLLFHNRAINATMGGTDTSGTGAPANDGNSPPTPPTLTALHQGDVCTDDARCSFIEPVGAGTGRAERIWPGNDQANFVKTQQWLASLPTDLGEDDPRMTDNPPPATIENPDGD